jgi:hypothetical protein
MTKKFFVVFLVLLLSITTVVVACADCNTQNQEQNQNQEQIQTQNQDQKQTQSQSVSISGQNVMVNVPKDLNSLDVGSAKTFSRLVYPGEVLVEPVGHGGGCSIISAYPVGLYTIAPLNGYGVDMVQTTEAQPEYDPIYHKMDFGIVPVIDKIDYWTTKAFLSVTNGSYCVLDNRAPGNDFTTVEFTIYEPIFGDNI